MRWLVDGYNVVRRDPELKAREAESLEAGRRALLHLLARARLAPHDDFTVVFDGGRRADAALASAPKRRRRGELGPQGPGRGPPGRQCRSNCRAIPGSAGGS